MKDTNYEICLKTCRLLRQFHANSCHLYLILQVFQQIVLVSNSYRIIGFRKMFHLRQFPLPLPVLQAAIRRESAQGVLLPGSLPWGPSPLESWQLYTGRLRILVIGSWHLHDYVRAWKWFLHYWSFVRRNHWCWWCRKRQWLYRKEGHVYTLAKCVSCTKNCLAI